VATTALDSPGTEAGGAAPSIAELIAGSSGPVENDGATSLDDLRDELREPIAGEQLTLPVVHRRRQHGRTGRKRGRPRKEIPTPPADPAPPSEPAPELLGNSKVTKAELAQQLAIAESRVQELDAQLLMERARTDVEKVNDLDNLVQMAAIFAYGQIAEVRGPHWALDEAGAEKIGHPTAKALAPYAARLNVAIPWVAAVLAIADVTWARVKIDKQLVRSLQHDGTRP
jgi:hypothetical protein